MAKTFSSVASVVGIALGVGCGDDTGTGNWVGGKPVGGKWVGGKWVAGSPVMLAVGVRGLGTGAVRQLAKLHNIPKNVNSRKVCRCMKWLPVASDVNTHDV